MHEIDKKKAIRPNKIQIVRNKKKLRIVLSMRLMKENHTIKN